MFDAAGTENARRQANLAQFFSLYRRWCPDSGVDQSYQVNSFSTPMVNAEHLPGLKLKAAEAGVMMRFTVRFCSDFRTKLPQGHLLHSAGVCLLDYMRTLKEAPQKIGVAQCRELLHLCLRHLHLMQEAGAKNQPKSHLFVHVTKRILRCGNPKGYSTFWDEGLNLVISNMAGAASRNNWHEAIFYRVRLLPHVQKNSAFAIV